MCQELDFVLTIALKTPSHTYWKATLSSLNGTIGIKVIIIIIIYLKLNS